MKLKLKCCAGVHKEMVTAVAWTPDNELYSMSDDNTIHRWDGSGDPAGKVSGRCRVQKTKEWIADGNI